MTVEVLSAFVERLKPGDCFNMSDGVLVEYRNHRLDGDMIWFVVRQTEPADPEKPFACLGLPADMLLEISTETIN